MDANRHFILFYRTVDGYVEKRAPYRAEHLALAHRSREAGHLVLAGALADPSDGAVLVFKGEKRAIAEAFAQSDPYVINGLITHWEVREWTVVLNAFD